MHPNFYCSPVNVFVLWLSGYVSKSDSSVIYFMYFLGIITVLILKLRVILGDQRFPDI